MTFQWIRPEAEQSASTPEPPRAPSGPLPPAEQPTVPEPQEIDSSTLSLAEYIALRAQLGVADHGEQNISRAPGHSEASGQGLFDGVPGYHDPRQANLRVFDSQLPDNRRSVPPGYRRSAEPSEEWK